MLPSAAWPIFQYLLAQGQINSWLNGIVIINIAVNGCAKSTKSHQSEQNRRVRRELLGVDVNVVQPLIRDDSHVGKLKEVIRKEGGARKSKTAS